MRALASTEQKLYDGDSYFELATLTRWVGCEAVSYRVVLGCVLLLLAVPGRRVKLASYNTPLVGLYQSVTDIAHAQQPAGG